MPALIPTLRSLPRPFWILFGGTFVNRFGTFVMPFLAIYLTRNGYSARQAGLAISAYGAGHIIASMLGGHLADRIGRRHTIALSMLGSAAMMMALSQARGFPAIVICTFCVGAVGELYRPAATALLGDLVQPEQRVAAFGMYRFAINLGFAFGPATAGFLADRSFFWVFAIDAATSFTYGLIALFALPHGLRSAAKSETRAEGLRDALGNRPFVLFLLATLCVTSVEFQLQSTMPLYVQSLGHSASTFGMLMSFNGVLIVLLELALVSWTQRFRPQTMIALGYALTGIGIGLTGAGRTVPFLAMTVVIWTFGEMVFAPVTGAYVTGLAPERYRGRYMGLWHLMWSTGLLLGPTLGTTLFAYSPRLLWVACATLGLVAATLSVLDYATIIRMTRRVLPFLSLLLLSLAAFADSRMMDLPARTPNAATVSGTVSSVSGNLIRLAEGGIVIDATGAKVIVDKGAEGTAANIQPGMLVFATLTNADVAANAPLPASLITATRLPDATLFGPVQAVDAAAKTITLLGRTVKVTADTSFGGIYKRRDGTTPSLSDIVPGQLVQVHVDSANGQLVAESILVVAPVIPDVQTTKGTVKSIATDRWVIERERGDDITLVIDAQTKIAGSPKVGDTVEVLYRVDSSNALVAISIIKFEKPVIPPMTDVFRFSGKVKSIAATSWVITRESGDQTVVINSNSKIEPGIAVGDNVEVLAQRKDDGTVTALAIVRRR